MNDGKLSTTYILFIVVDILSLHFKFHSFLQPSRLFPIHSSFWKQTLGCEQRKEECEWDYDRDGNYLELNKEKKGKEKSSRLLPSPFPIFSITNPIHWSAVTRICPKVPTSRNPSVSQSLPIDSWNWKWYENGKGDMMVCKRQLSVMPSCSFLSLSFLYRQFPVQPFIWMLRLSRSLSR